MFEIHNLFLAGAILVILYILYELYLHYWHTKTYKALCQHLVVHRGRWHTFDDLKRATAIGADQLAFLLFGMYSNGQLLIEVHQIPLTYEDQMRRIVRDAVVREGDKVLNNQEFFTEEENYNTAKQALFHNTNFLLRAFYDNHGFEPDAAACMKYRILIR